MRPGRRIELEAHALDDEGRGVARAEGREISVFDLLPGERAEVVVEHVSPHAPRAWGRVVGRANPASPERARPACPAFGRCGGCSLQHLAYPAQLREKRRRVLRHLEGALGDAAPPVAETVASPRVLGYRSRGKYVAARAGGSLVLGAYEPRSHRVVETLGCRVVEPAVDRAATAARRALAATDLEVHDERSREGELRYVIARSGAGGRVLVGLVTTSGARERELSRAARAIAREDGVAGVVWVKNDARSGALLSPDVRVLCGDGTVEEEIGPALARLDIGAFSQVNRAQARALHRAAAALADARPGARALELYCGAGAIALHLAEAGADVVGIERHEPAVATAREAAAALGVADRARFRAGDAAGAAALAGPAEVAVVDPPRKGLAPEAVEALAALRPGVLVYVSCSPATFARDAAALAARGYALDTAQPWDLMPGTPQVEILARFRAG